MVNVLDGRFLAFYVFIFSFLSWDIFSMYIWCGGEEEMKACFCNVQPFSGFQGCPHGDRLVIFLLLMLVELVLTYGLRFKEMAINKVVFRPC
uniref:Uncharacterized protein n=1 Tax=Rhizophora mucronata TaxID=61149 RepID=A0A2P2N2R6_RHIMU